MHHLLETWFNWVLTGGYIGIVFGLSHYVLGIAVHRASAGRKVRPFRVAQRKETGTSRALAGPLRGGRSFLCSPASGGSPFDFDPGGDCSDELRSFQFRHHRWLRALVLDPGLPWRQSLSP